MRVAHQAGRHPLRPQLTWAPPTLTNPVTIDLSASNRRALMRPDTDYIIKMPNVPVDVADGIELTGGRNVVLIGGEVHPTQDYSGNAYPGPANLGIKIQGNSSTFTYTGAGAPIYPQNVHIEGVKFSSTDPGYFADVCDILGQQQSTGTEMTVTFQNIRVDGLSYGWYQNSDGSQGPHADIIQNYFGPYQIRMDRFTATQVGYQGFFLQEDEYYIGDFATYDYRRVNLQPSNGVVPTGMTIPSGGHYMMFQVYTANNVSCNDVWLNQDPTVAYDNPWYPTTGYWVNGVNLGIPPGGDFVPLNVAGIGYTSPGYIQ
jgi:hypothetical protein